MKKDTRTNQEKATLAKEFKYLYWKQKQTARMDGIGEVDSIGANGQRLAVRRNPNAR
ncbi:hypothetical protein [Variovorax sp. LG9.2]|uniref:hypothetical protein n=1 Tax=Variovorax sp. LG9.2 TaxID=3048626 RepID=UPI002B23E2F5|nr:hypothetical protein [Variovorax sp. LG9.2]MEB0057289.1 hypothetical protein [Variovorax sp. LG9.2]